MGRALGRALVASAVLGLAAAVSSAAPVTDWHTFRATTAAPLAGQGTDDPVVGTLTETADAAFVIGYLGTDVTLTQVGDQAVLSFGVRFNDTTGISNSGDNFRFALFDENGETPETTGAVATAGTDNTDQYRGYWFGVKNGTGTGSGGSIRERIADLVSGDNAFAAAGTNGPTAPSLGAVGGDPVTLTSSLNGDDTGPTYTGQLVVTKTATGYDLSGSFIGSNAATGNVFSASDTTAPPPSGTFGAVGFLIGDALNVEQVSLQDVSVSYIPVPEPSSLAVLGLGALAWMRRRRG
jgi:hypothetical protein